MVSYETFVEYAKPGHAEQALAYYRTIESNPMMKKLNAWFKSELRNEEGKTVIYSLWNLPSFVTESIGKGIMTNAVMMLEEGSGGSVTWRKV